LFTSLYTDGMMLGRGDWGAANSWLWDRSFPAWEHYSTSRAVLHRWSSRRRRGRRRWCNCCSSI